MATEPPSPVPKLTPLAATTKRGFATASLSLGLWGALVFWWYPFGLAIAATGVLLGIIAVLLGYRAGKDGEHLAVVGIVIGSIGVGLAITVYRFMQLAFEGSPTGSGLLPLP